MTMSRVSDLTRSEDRFGSREPRARGALRDNFFSSGIASVFRVRRVHNRVHTTDDSSPLLIFNGPVGADVGHKGRRHTSHHRVDEVLRLRTTEDLLSSRHARISKGAPYGTSLAAKGDVLNHGPRLVAPPVGSKWRTRLPH